jgi:hypothetical protein
VPQVLTWLGTLWLETAIQIKKCPPLLGQKNLIKNICDKKKYRSVLPCANSARARHWISKVRVQLRVQGRVRVLGSVRGRAVGGKKVRVGSKYARELLGVAILI